jgi:hypothetical protein
VRLDEAEASGLLFTSTPLWTSTPPSHIGSERSIGMHARALEERWAEPCINLHPSQSREMYSTSCVQRLPQRKFKRGAVYWTAHAVLTAPLLGLHRALHASGTGAGHMRAARGALQTSTTANMNCLQRATVRV